MQNRVFVINKHGKALMPCKPRKAIDKIGIALL